MVHKSFHKISSFHQHNESERQGTHVCRPLPSGKMSHTAGGKAKSLFFIPNPRAFAAVSERVKAGSLGACRCMNTCLYAHGDREMAILMRKKSGPWESPGSGRKVFKLCPSPNPSGILGNLVSGFELRVTAPLTLIPTLVCVYLDQANSIPSPQLSPGAGVH